MTHTIEGPAKTGPADHDTGAAAAPVATVPPAAATAAAPTGEDDAAALQAAARQDYRRSVAAAAPLTGAQLGERHGRSARWGRERISEVRAKDDAAAAAAAARTAAAVPPSPAKTPVVREGSPQNPTRIAQEPAQEPSTGLPRPSGHPQPDQMVTEPAPLTAVNGTPHPTAAAAADPSGSPGSHNGSHNDSPRTAVTATAAAAIPATAADTASGKTVAWVAFAAGITASVAANVLHAGQPDVTGHGASRAELVGAAFWPLALLMAVELLTRVRWHRGFWWAVGRFGGVTLVGGVAAIISYRHMAGLMTSWGEDPLNAHLGPLAVDGLMLISATALLAIGRGAGGSR